MFLVFLFIQLPGYVARTSVHIDSDSASCLDRAGWVLSIGNKQTI